MELKFDPGFRVIGEYLKQINSILRVNFWIEFLGQNDSIFFFQCVSRSSLFNPSANSSVLTPKKSQRQRRSFLPLTSVALTCYFSCCNEVELCNLLYGTAENTCQSVFAVYEICNMEGFYWKKFTLLVI